MTEVSKTGHFKIDLPSSDAATALSGPGNSFLKKFESLTGVSLTIRGLQLEMNGVISKIERASALVELTRPIWEQGLEVPEVDLKAALSSLNMGESSSHAELGKKILARSKDGRYLRPLFDSLHSIFGVDRTNSLVDKGIIEVAPLAFMRGRTLDNSMVILDEAQNTTCSQMRMFLTRLGERSKMVVNGDITQIDLKKDQESGLIEASRIFSETQGIKFCYLTVEYVVRHPLVQKIIESYQ